MHCQEDPAPHPPHLSVPVCVFSQWRSFSREQNASDTEGIDAPPAADVGGRGSVTDDRNTRGQVPANVVPVTVGTYSVGHSRLGSGSRTASWPVLYTTGRGGQLPRQEPGILKSYVCDWQVLRQLLHWISLRLGWFAAHYLPGCANLLISIDCGFFSPLSPAVRWRGLVQY